MAAIPLQFNFGFGELTEAEYKIFLIEVASEEKSGTASLTIAVQPGGWAKSSSGFIQNNTDELLEQNIVVTVTDGIFELEVGCHNSVPIEVPGYLILSSFTQDPDTVIIFQDSFASAVITEIESDPDTWQIQTTSNHWRFIWEPIEESIPVETYISFDNGYEFTLSESTMASERQIAILPAKYFGDEPLSETTNIVLEVDTEFISHDLEINELPFYGFWVVGTDASLWIDLRPSSYFEADPALIKYPGLSGWYQWSPYDFIALGEGKHTIDISQFDEYLGGGVVSIMFSSYLKLIPW